MYQTHSFTVGKQKEPNWERPTEASTDCTTSSPQPWCAWKQISTWAASFMVMIKVNHKVYNGALQDLNHQPSEIRGAKQFNCQDIQRIGPTKFCLIIYAINQVFVFVLPSVSLAYSLFFMAIYLSTEWLLDVLLPQAIFCKDYSFILGCQNFCSLH